MLRSRCLQFLHDTRGSAQLSRPKFRALRLEIIHVLLSLRFLGLLVLFTFQEARMFFPGLLCCILATGFQRIHPGRVFRRFKG